MKPMNLKNTKCVSTHYEGVSEEKLNELSLAVSQCLKNQPFVVVAIIGNKGVGKSVLGKQFRRRGFGVFRPRQIAVIDDDNMAVDFFFFFRRWHAIACDGVDELVPFYKYCKRKPVRVYIKSNPESRITKANVVLKVSVDDERRRQQLVQRYGRDKGEAVFHNTQGYLLETKIEFDYELSAEIK